MLSEGASEPLRRPLRGRLVPGLALTRNSPVQRPLILVCLARTSLLASLDSFQTLVFGDIAGDMCVRGMIVPISVLDLILPARAR